MRPYLAVLSARIRMLLQYRAAALAGMSTQLFWGLIRVMTFEAFYRTATQAQPMTYAEVVNYVWLGQALFALLPWTPDNDVRTMVRTGTVASRWPMSWCGPLICTPFGTAAPSPTAQPPLCCAQRRCSVWPCSSSACKLPRPRLRLGPWPWWALSS